MYVFHQNIIKTIHQNRAYNHKCRLSYVGKVVDLNYHKHGYLRHDNDPFYSIQSTLNSLIKVPWVIKVPQPQNFYFKQQYRSNKSTAIQNVITGTIAVIYYFGILILWHFRTNAINPQPRTLSLYALMRPLCTISKSNSAYFY